MRRWGRERVPADDADRLVDGDPPNQNPGAPERPRAHHAQDTASELYDGDTAISEQAVHAKVANPGANLDPGANPGAPERCCCARRLVLIGFYIGSWYCCSIGLTLYNKWLFSIYKFNYPILVTTLHMALKAPFAKLAMCLFGIPHVKFASVNQYLYIVVPVGVATSLDVVLSNSSFQFITVTFYTIIKSSVPVWILIFSFALGLLRPSWRLVGIILIICSGISLASLDGNMSGRWEGAALCAGASVCAGARWAFSQMLLQPDVGKVLPARESRTALFSKKAFPNSAGAPSLKWIELPVTSLSRHASERQLLAAHPQRPQAMEQLEIGSHSGINTELNREREKGNSDISAEEDGERKNGAADNAKNAERRPEVNPVAFLWYTSPWAALTLVPAGFMKELMPLLESPFMQDRKSFLEVVALASVGALVAFFLLLAELLLVRATSGLTLSVAGIFKEVLTICASILILGEELSLVNTLGLGVTLLGVVAYNVLMMKQGKGAHGSSGSAAAAAETDSHASGGGAQPRAASLTEIGAPAELVATLASSRH